jgi:hypothetical protein
MSAPLRRLAVASTLALAALAAVAPSVLGQGATLNNAHYGGIGTQNYGVQPVAVVLSSDGASVKSFRVTSNYLCPGGGARVLNEDFSAPVGSDGSFSRQITFAPTTTSSGSVQRSFDLKGKADVNEASGTFQGTVVVRDANGNVTETCDTGVVSWSAERNGVASGRTNQNRGAYLKADLGGKPSAFGISWLTGNCQPSNSSASFSTFVDKITADKKNRHFSAKGTQTLTTVTGLKYVVDYTLAGKRTAKGAKGTFQAFATVTGSDGKLLGDKCDTGELKYTVRLG